MAIFKCKMCGGDLEISENITVAECEYCGTKQTVPKAMDENLQNLFNRATTLRIKSEFDKAEKLYEKIVQADPTQAEAYWGLILCKFGIEYVDDPATYKKIPTCHRASYDSIVADEDYRAAIEHADLSQRALYEEQAKEIDNIQKEILALAQKEESYDVFICYKETDAEGKRTQDSVIANDIYYQLTQEGFKVFYAAITLEGKLGSAYEPIIFAALNSAKVMLSIGTKPEYFNAVWVKNEWSRFLKIVQKDRSKILIPCYRDMDAYELPEEFAHLQAQDMAKIGFINDLVRGIKKVVTKETPAEPTGKESAVSVGNAAVAPLLERAFMFLEDGDFARADEFCEQVLNQDPKNAKAYLGKLMAELKVKTQEALKDQAEPFDGSSNYQKAIRFADDKFKGVLSGYIEHINTRNENARLDSIYTRAKKAMSAASTEGEYKEAAKLFESVSEYLDSEALAQSCYEKAEIARKEKERKEEIARKEAERIAKRSKKIAIITIPIVCAIIAFIIVLNTVIIPTRNRNAAIEKYGIEFVTEIENLNVGETYIFGTYEQDNNDSNGKEEIEWLVLEKQDHKVLLISKYALDCKQYNTSYTDVTWKTCTLRKWLNNDFINAAFSEEEKAMIPTVTVSAEKNPDYSTNPDKATQDQVFLLSITEANKYFTSSIARQCEPTDYAVANGAFVNRDTCWWWLLSSDDHYASYVNTSGFVSEDGTNVNVASNAVRPALWIDLYS